ncbi:SGNH/GDSL hydrolase family protein [Modestobacter lapidis]|nr:SGNH/GDSL hydrolase family protein [Modestobacter lapidis]
MHLAPRRPARVRAALATAVCGAVLTAATACGGSPAAEDRQPAGPAAVAAPSSVAASPAPVEAPAAAAVTSFVAVGDSLTAGPVPLPELRFPGSGSWVGAAQGAALDLRGGWAVPGATTADMLAGVQRQDADVVVVLAGTNDISRGIPWATRAANIQAIVATVGAGDVLLSAVPPLDPHPAEALDHNSRLAALAQERGWAFTDPWTGVRTPAGTFVPGASADGVHPTPEVADAAGRRIREALLTGAGA